MELVILGLIVFTVYVAIRFIASFSGWITRSRYRSYRTLAAKYQGRYENRGLSEPPTVSFNYNGSNVRVGLAPQVPGQALGPRTRVVARFRTGLPFRLELAPAAQHAPPQPPKGTRLVRLGEPDFDRHFIVQANDPDMARGFLSTEARQAIIALLRLAPPSGMLLSINPERMLVQVDRNLAQIADSLLVAVRHALLIHDGIQRGVASRLREGISIVDSRETIPIESGPALCKVCGELIETPGVFCAVCKTPHHRDCWEFVGSCSIYGCNGRQCLPESDVAPGS